MKTYLGALLCLCITAATFAEDQKASRKADDLAARYADAAAYFEIVAEALAKSGKENAKAKALRDHAMLYSLLLANEGRTQEFAVKVTHARIEVSKKDMLKEMGYRNENIAIIVNKYGDSSLELMENPAKDDRDLLETAARNVEKAP